MRQPIEQLYPDDTDWQQLCQKLKSAITLSALVLTAWQMGLWVPELLLSNN